MWLVDIISGLCFLVGGLFMVAGAVGMLRMPDLYTRIHACSLTDTGGAVFILLGLFIQDVFVIQNTMAAIKLLLILVFIAFTAPTASHAISKMALMSGLIPKCPNGRSVVEESLVLSDLPQHKTQNNNQETP